MISQITYAFGLPLNEQNLHAAISPLLGQAFLV
jgi:hypothetical protein